MTSGFSISFGKICIFGRKIFSTWENPIQDQSQAIYSLLGTIYKSISLPKYLKLRVSLVESRKQNWLCQLQMLPIPNSSGMWNVI